MKKPILLIAIAALLFGCSHFQRAWFAMGSNPYADDADLIAVGKRVFETNCTQCHGANGAGDGPQVPRLSTKPRNLTSPEFDKSLGLVTANIYYGKGQEMPAFGKALSEKEIWSVGSYLRTLNSQK